MEGLNISGLLFALVLAVLSGIVAYVSDRVGWRVAKRRISVFNLRPRVVSTGIAILTGMVIAVGTLGVLLVSSSNVREMVLHFDELQEDLTRVNNELEDTRNQLATAKRDREQAQQELTEIREQRSSLEQEISGLQERLEQNNRELSNLQEELNQSREELASLERQNRQARRELETQRERFEEEISQLESTRDELQSEISGLEQELAQLREETEFLRTGRPGGPLLYSRNPLMYQSVPSGLDMDQTVELVERSLDDLEAQLGQRGITVQRPGDEVIRDAARRLQDLQGDRPAILVVFARENIFRGEEEVQVDFAAVPQEVIYQQGEELVRFSVPADSSAEEVTDILEEQLTLLKQQAIDDGILPRLEDLTVGTIPTELVQSWVQRLSGLQEPVEVVLVAGQDYYVRDRLTDLELKITGPAGEDGAAETSL